MIKKIGKKKVDVLFDDFEEREWSRRRKRKQNVNVHGVNDCGALENVEHECVILT